MLVVKGRVFFKGRLVAAAVGIADGKVVAVKKVLRGEETSDFGDSLILPGCVDAHVHLRDPGLTRKEDFPSGTRSAALGGVSTVADMPNTVPPVTTRVAFEEKAAALRGRAAVDYALYAAPRSGSAVPRMPDAIGFKVYMAETTGDLQIDEEAMEDVLEAAGDADRLVVVHAEDARRFTRPARGGLEGHHMARPKESEVSAIQALGKMSRGARVHVAHVTCTEALDAVPAGVTKEATPHHLLLDFRRDLKAFGKVNPPLRSPEDRGALWRAYVEGRVDLVASDHAPHAIEEKEELFAEVRDGLYVTNTWYTRYQSYVSGDFSTIPRDGIFKVKDGEIVGAVKDLRLTDNILGLWQRMEALSKERQEVMWWGEVSVPSLVPYGLARQIGFTKSSM